MLRPCLVLINAKKEKKNKTTKMKLHVQQYVEWQHSVDKQNKVIIVNRYELTWTHCTASLQFK